jgi:hypothetical protein
MFFPAADTIAFAEGGAEVMRIDSAGNVGIGTTSPIQLLTLESTSNIRSTIRNSTENTSYACSLDFATGSGSLSSTNVVGRVIGLVTQADPSTLQSALTFHTNGGDSVAERMRIDTSGNVGIGIIPSQKLQVAGNVMVGSVSAGATLFLQNATTYWSLEQSTSNFIIANSGTERARIDSSGKLILSAANQGIQFADGTNQTTAAGLTQTITTTKTDTFSATTSTYTDITGLSVTITPTSSSNRILIIAMVNVSSTNNESVTLQLVRNSTAICLGDAASNRPRATSATPFISNSLNGQPIIFVDSPATTSATTYKLQGRVSAGSFNINRSNADTDNSAHPRTASTITVMEIR